MLTSENIQQQVGDITGTDSNPLGPWRFHRDSPPESVPFDLLPKLAEMTNSQDEKEIQQGVLLIRKLLTVKENPPIQAVVDAGVCVRLVTCMQHADNELRLNASFALSSIAASGASFSQHVIDLGDDCKEQASLALGNIAGIGARYRNDVLEKGAMSPLLNNIQTCSPENLSLLRAAVTATSNLCRSKPLPPLDHVSPAFPILALAIQHPDTDIASNSLEALADSCSGTPDQVQLVIDCGVVPLIVSILDSQNENFHPSAFGSSAASAVGTTITFKLSSTPVALIISKGILTLKDPRRGNLTPVKYFRQQYRTHSGSD